MLWDKAIPKKAQALLWSFSCSEECASSLVACEHFFPNTIFGIRGVEESRRRVRVATAYYVNDD